MEMGKILGTFIKAILIYILEIKRYINLSYMQPSDSGVTYKNNITVNASINIKPSDIDYFEYFLISSSERPNLLAKSRTSSEILDDDAGWRTGAVEVAPEPVEASEVVRSKAVNNPNKRTPV